MEMYAPKCSQEAETKANPRNHTIEVGELERAQHRRNMADNPYLTLEDLLLFEETGSTSTELSL